MREIINQQFIMGTPNKNGKVYQMTVEVLFDGEVPMGVIVAVYDEDGRPLHERVFK